MLPYIMSFKTGSSSALTFVEESLCHELLCHEFGTSGPFWDIESSPD